MLQDCEDPSLVNCCSGGSQGGVSSEKWITMRNGLCNRGRAPGCRTPGLTASGPSTARTHRTPRMKARPRPCLARTSDASRASGTRTLIHSLHSFCRRRPRALSDRPPARSPVSVDTSLGDEGRAVAAEQQQRREEQRPPFPPTRLGLGRRPRDARPPAVSACAREPAL